MIVSVPKTGGLRLGDQGDMTYGEFAATIAKQVKEFGSGYCLRIRADRKTLYSQIRPVVQTAFENKLYPRLDLYAPSWGAYAVLVHNPTTMMELKSGQVIIRVRIGHDQLMWDGKPITQDWLRDIVYQLGDIDGGCPFVLEVENDATCQDIANVLGLCTSVGLRQIYLQDAPPRNSTSPAAPASK